MIDRLFDPAIQNNADALREKLHEPLNPDLDYFDATPSIEQLAEQMKRLTEMLRLQLGVNAQLIENQSILLARIEALEGKPKSAIIMPRGLNS
jgi:hypothetical protein